MIQSHVSQKKKDEVALLVSLLKKYSAIGVVNLTSLPAPQLRSMRGQLKESVLIRGTKKRLIKLAFEKIKSEKNLSELEKYLNNAIPALVFTNEDPFKLAKILKKSKTPAPAKPGQIAPKEIVIPAGPTEFPPGPIIGELGQIGVLAGVEEGKVAVKKDSVVAKEGDVFTPKLAEVLGKLGIAPMEIGLNIVAVYDKGMIFTKSILEVDEEAYVGALAKNHAESLALALSIGYLTKETVDLLLGKANAEANALAKEANILTSEAVSEDISEAERAALSLKENVPEAKDDHHKSKEEVDLINRKKAQYSDEEAKKAQDIINAMKDKDIHSKGG